MLSIARDDARKVADNHVVRAEVRAWGWRGSPGHRLSDAPGQSPYEVAAKAHWVEVIKDLGPVVFDLSQEDLLKGRATRQAMFGCPLALQDLVVPSGE